jgi:DNA-binding MarR family transcriptional regulator
VCVRCCRVDPNGRVFIVARNFIVYYVIVEGVFAQTKKSETEEAAERTDRSDRRVSSLTLDEQLSFALYAASRAVINAYRPLLRELGLTYPQYLVMLVLWERGDCLIKDLGTVLRLDYGTLSPLLKRLEAAGLIRRARRAEDERSVQVMLTDKGTALRQEAEAVPMFIGDALGLDSESLAALRTTLGRLTALVSASR